MAFRRVTSAGYCCTLQLREENDGSLTNVTTGRTVEDPDGLAVRLDCTDAQEEARQCRALPSNVRTMPGVLTLPIGCDQALADAGMESAEDNVPLRLEDVDGDLGALWDFQCLLPPRDQDYDGVGDACDLCEFVYDPENTQYVDAFGKLWPQSGAFCNGEYLPDVVCQDDDMMDPTGTGGTDGETDGDEPTAGDDMGSTG